LRGVADGDLDDGGAGLVVVGDGDGPEGDVTAAGAHLLGAGVGGDGFADLRCPFGAGLAGGLGPFLLASVDGFALGHQRAPESWRAATGSWAKKSSVSRTDGSTMFPVNV